MIPIILSIFLMVTLVFSIAVVVQRRKKHGIKGVKSALTPICFFLIALINLAAYWFDFLGLINWSLTVILLILAAYFTRYMKVVH